MSHEAPFGVVAVVDSRNSVGNALGLVEGDVLGKALSEVEGDVDGDSLGLVDHGPPGISVGAGVDD